MVYQLFHVEESVISLKRSSQNEYIMIDFNNNANHVRFDIKGLILSSSKDRVRSKVLSEIQKNIF